MKRRFLFVLRGRPGLGHVMPGYALAQELKRHGHVVRILTYRNGTAFLAHAGWDDLVDVVVESAYRDWPGLDLYDHGVGVLLPLVEEFEPDVVVLGGEYLLAPLGEVVHAPVGLIYNPEIFQRSNRNRLAGRAFGALLRRCDFLLPMCPAPTGDLLDAGRTVVRRSWPPGPFRPGPSREDATRRDTRGLSLVIANGGGIDFPTAARSYASVDVDPELWLTETAEMTQASIAAALAVASDDDTIAVFSCLGPEPNREISRLTDDRRVMIEQPGSTYLEAVEHADVVISRAGSGFVADAEASRAHVVLWALTHHDEQQANAEGLVRRRAGTARCRSARDLRLAVAEAVMRARRGPPHWNAMSKRHAQVEHTRVTASRLVELATSAPTSHDLDEGA
ncbi:MAG: glycosyltransferase [Tepidisphaeraceae bacterium]